VPDVPSGYPDFYFPDGKPDSWFDDVLFIGDSRTVGLKMYARSGNAEYFCDVGATVFNIQTKVLSDNGFSNQTLEELLSSKTYGKIFINLGLNEIGYPLTSVYNRYEQLVDFVKQKQPNAIIILQGVMSVTRQKASQADYFSPSTIATLNNKIRSYANGKNVFYIDCNTYLADTEGYLYTSLTNDGYHPTGTGYRIWHNWIHWAVGQLSL
jgi:lysophospholipase L1-like esterase